MFKTAWARWFSRIATVIVVASLVAPSDAMAQDCGSDCGFCASGMKEGYTYHAQGEYNMSCLAATTGCVKCARGDNLVKDPANAPGSALQMIRSATKSELVGLAVRFKDVLVVHPARGLVGMKGEACTAKSVVALTFISAERMQALVRGGVPTLTEFLGESKAN